LEEEGASGKSLYERILPIAMLVATAAFAIIILVIPGKLAPHSEIPENRTDGIGSYLLPNLGAEIPTFSLPLSKVIRMPVSSSYVFKVVLVSGEVVEGMLSESGGSCFAFYVLDEAAYALYAKSGPSSFTKGDGVYVSVAPAHSSAKFELVADRTGDFYFVLMSPPGSCRGKVVDIELRK